MKRRWIILVGLLAVAALCGLLLGLRGDSEQKAVEETRRAMHQEGFKTDLAEFDFSASEEERARAAALTRGEFSRTYNRESNYGWGSLSRAEHPDLMAAAGTDAAVVVWKQKELLFPPNSYPRWRGHEPGGDLWPALRTTLSENRADLDSACAAALSGPIRFNLVASQGNAILLPHAAVLKSLIRLLGTRVVLELRDGNSETAWTNLLACTRLVTAWDPEPTEVSHAVRYACATIAYNTTWQALQAGGWGDDRLANLQREWESVDFFKGLADTAAFARASMVATCRAERQQPLLPLGLTVKEVIRAPRNAWYGLAHSRRQLRYRLHGSYEDEKALLLYYRDRELQLRRAVQSTSWLELRELPGVTNMAHFSSKYPSAMQCLMNLRQLGLAAMLYQQGGQGLSARAAEAEARRRLVVTAIALERYRGRHHSYPQTLLALVPEMLPKPPVDFMDGKPLRYRLTGDSHFVLYSVGLDCVDNEGSMERYARGQQPIQRFEPVGNPLDLIWPRAASIAEIKAQQREVRQDFH
jgi:hypothetical protein